MFEQASRIAPDWAPPLRRPGQLLHDPSFLHRRPARGGAAQGPGGAGPGPRARRDAGGSARGQRLHPGLLRVGLARRRAGVQARPRAAAQLRRRVLLLQPLSRVTPAARRGHRAARAGRRAGPALAPAAGEPRPARLLRGTLRRGGPPAAGDPQERLHRRDWQVGTGSRGGTAGTTRPRRSRSWSRSAAAASTASRRSAMPTRSPGGPPRRGASSPRCATAAARSYVPSYWFALLHAGLGQRDSALRYLERAYEERSTVLAYLLIDPRLAPLRDDPRFLALARRLGGE